VYIIDRVVCARSQELPTTIGQLKSLVILNADRNRLASLPAEVSSYTDTLV